MTDEVVLSWSGGIDSTALLGLLLQAGRRVRAINFRIYDDVAPLMAARERDARSVLLSKIRRGQGRVIMEECPGDWIWRFSPDGVEIPHRNKRIIDVMIDHLSPAAPARVEIALGEYVGADSWVVREHVGEQDADARWLSSYIVQEYGLRVRLWTLADFGESRYKSDRVALLLRAVGEEAALLTTNCMRNVPTHCGVCYKCIERAVAFDLTLGSGEDTTSYTVDPRARAEYGVYARQMAGEEVVLHPGEFQK